ncbi:MAG: S-methyl-5-thioribose-1-phosphate isomerase [Candidatus Diapherotrites archaeon CG08_land_8_20_14_0_20_34_12]|nr:MAG: S-methyl-5-thioribose-1-phosphate isomerase [Candidatus Diapherotrites archaeon CG08_land_8_20_14_0_20_34_12]
MLVKTKSGTKHYRTLWLEGKNVRMINQLKIPHEFEIATLKNYKETAEAIRNMTVRGAGAIGISGAYGIYQAVSSANKNNYLQYIRKAADFLRATRPTAYDLFYSVDHVLKTIKDSDNFEEAKKAALKDAEMLAEKNANAGKRIGQYGEKLIKNNFRILTHCNAGWLGFVDWGSALAPIYAAKRAGKKLFVFVDETRPRLQGARLTAWELYNEDIKHAVIADNAAGYYMQKGEIDMCIVGADRILMHNGLTANKIGTYEKAVLAKENNIPFYVAAPTSTFDLKSKEIPIEERSQDEVLFVEGNCGGKITNVAISHKNAKAKNPAFDITSSKYITAFITEKGIFKPNKLKRLEKMLKDK